MKYFLPSMIEVEFNDYYKKCVQYLINAGFKSFHIDFGDGFFISRKLLPWDKINYLISLNKNVKLTAHIMSNSGTHEGALEEITTNCLRENFETIYIHLKSFNDYKKLISFVDQYFPSKPNVLGLVSEATVCQKEDLIKIINDTKVSKILQMGVPLGKGGQNFVKGCLNKIDEIILKCPNIEYVELDGGLSFKIMHEVLSHKINAFSGWSIINNNSPEIVLKNALKIKSMLKQ